MKVICILSDAIRYDYLQYMPFLNSMKDKGDYIERIKPGIGFCEISEYISGLPSFQNDNVFQLTFNGQYGKVNNKTVSFLNSVFSKIPKIAKINNFIIDAYLSGIANIFPSPDVIRVRYNIPVHFLKYFMPTESAFVYDDDSFFNERNLFHILRSKDISYDISDFVQHNKIRGTDEDRLDRLQEKIIYKTLKDFTLLYIGYGELAHFLGTSSVLFKKQLKEYDDRLHSLYTSFVNNYKQDSHLIVLGDHGMVDVNSYINIEKKLKKIFKAKKLRPGEDAVYFIDSTVIRIWIDHNLLIKETIEEELKHFLGDAFDEVSFPQNVYDKYGDIILLLKPGYVFFPDFFNKKRIKGMHGYNNDIDEQHGFFLRVGSATRRYRYQEELCHIYDDILFLLKNNGIKM
jgi:hypothetical protein